MTAQIGERLHYQGQKVAMCEQPLATYFARINSHPEFEANCTALWRGYVGTWEILDERLYLIGLVATMKDGSPANLATLFPDYPERVFAHWYSGELRVPQGKLLEYVHQGYGSTYEQDLLITVAKGVVVGTSVRRNGKSDNPDSPEGYGIGGMTVFPRAKPGADAGS